VPDATLPDIDADVGYLLDRLRRAGVPRVLLVDLTRPDLDVPVVRVVIPGLEPVAAPSEYRPGPRAEALRRSWAASR
jgi:ribosomal protein S12 methylthiotransferase accessory factor